MHAFKAPERNREQHDGKVRRVAECLGVVVDFLLAGRPELWWIGKQDDVCASLLGKLHRLDILCKRAKGCVEEQDQVFSRLTGPGSELSVFLGRDRQLAAQQRGAVAQSNRMFDVVAYASLIETFQVSTETWNGDSRAAHQVV